MELVKGSYAPFFIVERNTGGKQGVIVTRWSMGNCNLADVVRLGELKLVQLFQYLCLTVPQFSAQLCMNLNVQF